MNIHIKSIAVPLFVALSLIFGACGDQTIESPDSIDDGVQESIEGVEESADDAGNAIDDGLKDLEKGAEDAAGAAQDGLKQGVEDTGNAIEGLGEEIPSSEE